MLQSIKKIDWSKILNYVAYSLGFSLVEYVGYQVLLNFSLQHIWLIVPIMLYVISSYGIKLSGYKGLSRRFLGIVTIISLFLMFMGINIEIVNVWVSQNSELLGFVIITLFFTNIVIAKNIKPEINLAPPAISTGALFNLFYVNTSKVHEIVMLIDNKIMKTIEREQVSEELLKSGSSFSMGDSGKWSIESGYAREDSSKKRVYENFDVKTTKSIMLRKVYDTTQKNKTKPEKLKLGDLTIFENIELQQGMLMIQ